ncbi:MULTISPECIES: YvrJ family protein [Anoxybacillus]|uniref:YvrJ family protein n=1 Tax=Anoxybacillus flavithermus TaxID=33934 RepID=A0A2G5RU74_9BACL|nr:MULTISPECIES: YvrJ family protein [Anoxybacillus]PIC06211.1 YvrJ family protein [Anoxybacillus flavithermus]
MEAYLSLLSDVGFPIAVTFYLLHRIEGKLDAVIDSIRTLGEQWKAPS